MGATLECSYESPAFGEPEWVLVSGPPASCTQLGLFHLFQDLPPVDLVVSGPNFGRNATTIYNLSSGTVGGALEAALCRKKAIALSFASKESHSSDIVDGASRLSVRLIEKLYRDWDDRVELYNINVPMVSNVENRKILYTEALTSRWTSGSLYHEIIINGVHEGESTKVKDSNGIRDGFVKTASRTRSFQWAPQLSDISRCVDESPPGTDAWAIKNSFTRYGIIHLPHSIESFNIFTSTVSLL